MNHTIITTYKRKTYEDELAPDAHVWIANVPMIIRRGGGRSDVREYMTFATARQLTSLRELARIRIANGEVDIHLDFGDDASAGRAAFKERARALGEQHRRRYGNRVRRGRARHRGPTVSAPTG